MPGKARKEKDLGRLGISRREGRSRSIANCTTGRLWLEYRRGSRGSDSVLPIEELSEYLLAQVTE